MQPDQQPRRTRPQQRSDGQPWWLSAGAAALVIAVLVALGGAAAAWLLTGASAAAAVGPPADPPVRQRTPTAAEIPDAGVSEATGDVLATRTAAPGRSGSPPDSAAPNSAAVASDESTSAAAPKPDRPVRLARVPARPRIMLLGDSITDGIGSSSRTGYRSELGARLAAAGVDYDFVGSQHSGHGPGDLDHEGHPGWRIDQVTDDVAGWLAAAHPDVVLLDIGTNDYVQAYRTAQAPHRLARLVDAILRESPTVRVVVAKLLVCGGADRAAGITELNATIADLAAAAGPRVSVADMSDIETVHTVDGVHPDDTGYRMMARRWVTALKPVLGLPG